MNNLAALIDRILEKVLVWLTAMMVVVVTWQVTTRYILNSPSSYTEELATYLLIWISLLGAALALRQKAHLGIDILTRKMTGKAKRISEIVSMVIVILFSALVLIAGGLRLVFVTLTLEQLSAAFKIPVGYVYTVLPLSGLLMAFYAIVAILNPAEPEASASIETKGEAI